ncbi:hypothetical protein THAOC_23572, partial [Thalassiosira oceanica]
MALPSMRGGPDADSPGSPPQVWVVQTKCPYCQAIRRPTMAGVSILPGDPSANDASVECFPGGFGSCGTG